MFLPPILFVAYITHSFRVMRQMVGASSSFHLSYANNLIQDFLGLALKQASTELTYCLEGGAADCPSQWLIASESETAHSYTIANKAYQLHPDYLPTNIAHFVNSNQGLKALIEPVKDHKPVFWFRVLDNAGTEVFRSGDDPDEKRFNAVFPMDRSLQGCQLEIIYTSFGPKQLYSVVKNRINFGTIYLLAILLVFSVILMTRSVRQTLVVARQKTFFVSTVSHEFKTPLSIIRLASETLAARRYRSEEDQTRFHQMIKREVDRMDYLVRKILNFAQIESGQVRFHQQPFELADVVRQSIELFQLPAKTDGIELVADLDPGRSTVSGDPDLVQHAIDNFIDNAFKYRGKSNRIELSMLTGEKQVTLTIRDHGIGMAPGELARIGRSFYRIPDPMAEGVRGSGLGLAISKYILKKMQARVEIESQLRKGTLIRVIFPLLESKGISS